MKTNLTNWLCGLCAVLLIAVLIFQFKQQGRLDALQRQQESLSSAVGQQQQQQRDLSARLANQVTNLGVSMESRLTQSKQQAESFLTKLQEQGSTNSAEMLQAIFQVSYDLRDRLTNELAVADAKNRLSANALIDRIGKETVAMKATLDGVLADQGQRLQAFTNGMLMQQTSFTSGMESRLTRNERLNTDSLAIMTNTVFQQTAVMHRALGKVIPVELPESLTNKLGLLAARMADEKSWPKDTTEADAMLAELRGLVRQIPPWAEEDLLPRLNGLRWGASGLALVARGQSVTNDALAVFLDSVDTALEAKPDGASELVANQLLATQGKFKAQLDSFQRDNAIISAERLIKDGGTASDFSEVQERLSEWAEVPEFKERFGKLQHDVRARELEADITRFVASLDASLLRIPDERSVMVRQISLGKLLDSAVSQRQVLIENPDAPAALGQKLAELSARIETTIEAEGKAQTAEQERKLRDYQRWALSQIQRFNSDVSVDEKGDKGRIYDSPDYPEIKTDMVKYLLPVSAAFLDPAISRLYNEAFEKGWKLLDGKDQKHLQTEVAKQEAIVEKRKP